MGRPSVYAKSVREGIFSAILISILVGATVLLASAPSWAAQSDDALMRQRRLGQSLMRVGQQQYDRGSYDQAQKTLQMAQEYKDCLDSIEQRKLRSLLEKVAQAAQGRVRVLEARQAAEQLRRAGDVAAARARLESIRGSEFLTEKERLEIAEALRDAESPGTASVANAGVSQTRDSAPVRQDGRIADQYYESVKAYLSGDYRTAREGFTKMLQSGALPAPMSRTVRGYLAEMDAKLGTGRLAVFPEIQVQTLPVVSAAALNAAA